MTWIAARRRFLLASVVTALAAFVFFTGMATYVDPTATHLPKVLARALAATLVGPLLIVLVRQRRPSTVGDAVTDGLLLAVVVIVSNSLFGSDDSGRELAIRTIGLLTGLPGLAALAHTLTRSDMSAGEPGSDRMT